jgi:O-6-methylguanine DNA methyltransferase
MPEVVAIRELSAPVGTIRLAATRQGIVRLALPRSGGAGFRGWLDGHLGEATTVDWLPPLDKASAELEEYFAGRRVTFDVPLDLRGTPFQRATWEALLRIPYGEVMTYGDVAGTLGRPGASRAVGGAVGSNPVAILVPCHRVVAAGGRLGGYTGGLDVKRKLLAIERARLPGMRS